MTVFPSYLVEIHSSDGSFDAPAAVCQEGLPHQGVIALLDEHCLGTALEKSCFLAYFNFCLFTFPLATKSPVAVIQVQLELTLFHSSLSLRKLGTSRPFLSLDFSFFSEGGKVRNAQI